MPAKIPVHTDLSAVQLRKLAARSHDANQSRRLLSIAAILDGMSRTDAARIGGMERQTLSDWVRRFNEEGPDGLIDRKPAGPACRLSVFQLAELTEMIESGPDPEALAEGVVRWRRADLQRVIKARFDVDYHERHVGRLLHDLGFSHMSTRPQHPSQDTEVIDDFKKLPRNVEQNPQGGFPGNAH